MSEYYKAQRVRNMYQPGAAVPFRLSRSKLELFVNCPRCFYLDRRHGLNLIPGYPFTLNVAVDTLLKHEFDHYRREQRVHPMCLEAGVDAVPFSHPELEQWRNSLKGGVTYHDKTTNLIITGGLDDLWQNREGQLIVVDYKATAKAGVLSIEADWQKSYKRQLSLYGWILKKNKFAVSELGYFVYCNGKVDAKEFNKKLNFEITLIPYRLEMDWIEPTIGSIYQHLNSDLIPPFTSTCDYCSFIQAQKQFIA